jgi:predicted DNA-binding transcriptional regulator AlpA
MSITSSGKSVPAADGPVIITHNQPPAPDQQVPDPKVCKEFGVTPKTLWEWTNDPALNFPPPAKIRNRNYRSRRALEAFKEQMLRNAIAHRGEQRAETQTK